MLSRKAAATCTGGGGDCATKAGGGLPMINMPIGGRGPSKPPPLIPPLTPPLTSGGVGCVGMLPVAYTSHWALSSKGPASCFGRTMHFERTPRTTHLDDGCCPDQLRGWTSSMDPYPMCPPSQMNCKEGDMRPAVVGVTAA